MPVKILIVDDHPIVRQGMKIYMEEEKTFEICGEAESATEAIKIINKTHPDIVTIDLSLEGETSGLELIKSIKNRFPEIKTIVISMFDEKLYAERSIRAGAHGYIMKKTAPATIVKAIHNVIKGKLYLSEAIAQDILSKLLQNPPRESNDPIEILGDKELEIFQLIAQGLSSNDISKKLNLNKNTVESHKRNIKEKLNLKSSQELIRFSERWLMENKF